MRRVMVCIWVLVTSAALFCASQLSAAAGGQQSQPGSSQKVINDPAEYNAYINALNTVDPSQKAAAMEAFVANYPNSVVKEDALEQALAAYQQAGKQAEVEKTARRILELNENNVRALAIIVVFKRDALSRGRKDVSAADLRVLAEQGLRAVSEWGKPAGLTQDDFDQLQKQVNLIFYGAAGFAALMEKDYTAARDYYYRALDIDPNDLPNTYQLSIADLEMRHPDVKGFWYVAHAIYLCERQRNETSAKMITNYGLEKYRKFHGSEEGWEQVLKRAATGTEPPRDFRVLSAGPNGTSASLTSNSSPGNAQGVSASILSADKASAGINRITAGQPSGPGASVLSSATEGTAHATPSSVLSAQSPGNAHSVPASVLSANSIGTAHNTSASATSSTTMHAGNTNQSAASVLHAASASAAAVGRAMALLKNSLGRNTQAATAR